MMNLSKHAIWQLNKLDQNHLTKELFVAFKQFGKILTWSSANCVYV